MKTVFLFIASWLIGLCAYVGSCALFYRQTISLSSADFRSAALYSFIAFAVAFCVVYLPSLLALRRLLHGVRPVWPFPLVAALLGVLPTALILFYWGGTLRSLLSPEASLFYAMFGAVGLIVGIGFTLIHRHDKVA
jgi:hypothetical protein